MGTVGKGVAFCGRVAREFFEVVDLKGQMRQVRANHDRAARIEFAKLNLFVALRRLKENELRAATRGVPANFPKPENIFIKRDRLLQIGDSISSVEEFFYHRILYLGVA